MLFSDKVAAHRLAVHALGRQDDITKGLQAVVTPVEVGHHDDGGRRAQVVVGVDLKRKREKKFAFYCFIISLEI